MAQTGLAMHQCVVIGGIAPYPYLGELGLWNTDFQVRLLSYAVLSVLCLLGTIGVAVRCLFNFDRGLKAYLQQSSLPDGQHGKEQIRRHVTTDSQEMHMLPRRMDLD